MRGGVHSDDWVETGGAVSAAARPTRGDASQSLMAGALLTDPFATTLSVSASLSVGEGSGSVVRAARRSARRLACDDDSPELEVVSWRVLVAGGRRTSRVL